MGSSLYKEVCHHYNQMSPPRVLFRSLIPAYNTKRNYLKHLNQMNSYKPNPTDSANTVLTKVKTLAIEMADSANDPNKSEYVFRQVRDKILSLYPSLAPTIIEHESRYNPTNIGEFSQLFLGMAPLFDLHNKKSARNTIYEILERDTSINDISPNLPIKLTRAHAQRLDGLCFKCANENPDQPPHFGRECALYKDTPLAMYICKRCEKGVHLPKFCKQSPDSIHQIEIIDSDYDSEEKN